MWKKFQKKIFVVVIWFLSFLPWSFVGVVVAEIRILLLFEFLLSIFNFCYHNHNHNHQHQFIYFFLLANNQLFFILFLVYVNVIHHTITKSHYYYYYCFCCCCRGRMLNWITKQNIRSDVCVIGVRVCIYVLVVPPFVADVIIVVKE